VTEATPLLQKIICAPLGFPQPKPRAKFEHSGSGILKDMFHRMSKILEVT